ncbi:MAG: AarF/ABC1/UbiB kinase family protein [Alphaproteobacteria bacterium]|nr:AarF/ABC1/UbiB kinase family protein [Alphaproteobacteria bacterium]
MRIVRPIVKTVERVPQRVRDLQRLNTVAQILVRHGFGMLVAGVEIPGFPGVTSSAFESTPARAVAALDELGPTFVKLGQVLSTRPDLLPEEYVTAFQQLQDDATPMPIAAVHAQLEQQLGEGWRDEVTSFDDTPIATASIAQVHGAVLRDGREVVFKVQRPGLERVIRADLNILHFLATRAMVEFPELATADVDGMLGEFERSILSELDFQVEARNQERVAANFGDDPRVRIPTVIQHLTTQRVLCMERLRGVKITEARAAGHDMEALGRRALAVTFDMLFVHGLFHADAHPGNVLVLPGGVVGLIDFGMVGRLTTQMRNDVIFIIFALQRGDYRTIARVFYEVAIKTHRIDYRALERDTIEVMEKHWSGHSIREMQLGPFVMDLARRAAKHGARMPPDYTMFFKALATVEGLAKTVLPEVDPIAAAAPYFEQLIRERLDYQRLQSDALYHALTLSSVARRLPISLSQFLDDLDAQRVKLGVELLPVPAAEERLDRRHNRLIAAIVAVGAGMCGTLALFPEGAWPGGWPVVSVVFYALCAAAGLWLVVGVAVVPRR